MKKQRYILISDNIRRNVLQAINDLECDGTTAIEIVPAGAKSDSQRGLQWMWYTDVATSGIGGEHESTKEGVHVVSKWMFAKSITKRDHPKDWVFVQTLLDHYEGNQDALYHIIDVYVHTEAFNTSQMAEYLTDFQRHYLDLGVNLRDPQDQGLLT